MKKVVLAALALLFVCHDIQSQNPIVIGDNMLCPQSTGTVATSQVFDTYQWYRRSYGSTVTNSVAGETNQILSMTYFAFAGSYVSVKTSIGGVSYLSQEYFVDGHMFSSPIVQSTGEFTIGGNNEAVLCSGDTMYFILKNPYNTNITWLKNGMLLAGQTTQTLEVTQPGSYYVQGAPYQCPNYIQSPGVALDVVQCLPTNIKDTEKLNLITISPNPTMAEVKIDNLPENSKIILYNSIGQEVEVVSEDYLDLTNEATGIYILKVINEKHEIYRKIIKY